MVGPHEAGSEHSVTAGGLGEAAAAMRALGEQEAASPESGVERPSNQEFLEGLKEGLQSELFGRTVDALARDLGPQPSLLPGSESHADGAEAVEDQVRKEVTGYVRTIDGIAAFNEQERAGGRKPDGKRVDVAEITLGEPGADAQYDVLSRLLNRSTPLEPSIGPGSGPGERHNRTQWSTVVGGETMVLMVDRSVKPGNPADSFSPLDGDTERWTLTHGI